MPIVIDRVNNMIWEKVIVGKDKIDAAMSHLKIENTKKKYEGVAIRLSYPEHILIVLPRIINPA